ncbi:uncharacterized protein LOC120479966 isoform X2 [Pimephales promelas]|uniref:uncharacterized protein LOC120479966 isoform X2 n=1 Tax=Pimephales promelas TaxID=90988 RepID=UPI001955810D|nr:uncharacterized protein LOC120479966 isoform X2 [Pimephales promelas]
MMFCWCTLVLLTLVPVVTVAKMIIEMLKQQDFQALTLSTPFQQYSVTGMKIESNLHSVQEFVEKSGITTTIKNFHMTGKLVNGQKNYPLDVNVEELGITVTLPVKVDETGHLTLSSENCKAKLGNYQIERTGSPELDVWKAVLSVIKFVFPGKLNNQVCSKVTTFLNTRLTNIYAYVRENSGVDVSLEPTTVISSDRIEVNFVALNGRKKRRLLEETKYSPEN